MFFQHGAGDHHAIPRQHAGMISGQQCAACTRHVFESLGAHAEIAAVHKAAEWPHQFDQLGVHAKGIGGVLAASAPLDQAGDLVDLILQHHTDPAPEIRVEIVAADVFADNRRCAAKLFGCHSRQILADQPQKIGHEIARLGRCLGLITDLDLNFLHRRNRVGVREARQLRWGQAILIGHVAPRFQAAAGSTAISVLTNPHGP
jgi:hypothetical protein